jgi:hypothetical protein
MTDHDNQEEDGPAKYSMIVTHLEVGIYRGWGQGAAETERNQPCGLTSVSSMGVNDAYQRWQMRTVFG